jgi:uncharacterized protein (TIGR00369 family)
MAKGDETPFEIGYDPPAAKLLGRKIVRIDRENKTTELSFDPSPDLMNRHGGLQGGFASALLDGAMGQALMPHIEKGQKTTTLEIKTSFLAPIPFGNLTAIGRVLRQGRSVAFVEAELRAGDEVCARSSATMRIITPKVSE